MKLVLDTKDLTDGFFEETKLLGIMASVKNYQFCWHLNNLLGIDFRLNNDLEIQLKKKNREYFFPVYEYAEQATCLKHYLYNNQRDGEYLLPEFRHLDFLWLLKDDYVPDDALQNLIQSIRTVSAVQLVTELTNEKIKNREHLVF
ncbi:MAG: IPExxxVDY family protein [Flavisolibacter sp.]